MVREGSDSSLVLKGVFRKRQDTTNESGMEYVSNQVRNLFPLPFILIGLTILFLRLENPSVWLLAIILCATAATPSFPPNVEMFPFGVRLLCLTLQVIAVSSLGPVFYCFFAGFPLRSPIDKRLPWLQWASIAMGITVFLVGEHVGALTFYSPLQRLLGDASGSNIAVAYIMVFIALGLSLIHI